MNTDRSASSYTRIKSARMVAANNTDRYTTIAQGVVKAFRGTNTNMGGSLVGDIKVGTVNGPCMDNASPPR